MQFKRTKSLMTMTEAEVTARLYYFYRLVKAMPSLEMEMAAVNLFIKLCKHFKRLSQFEQVMDAQIIRLILDGALHVVQDEDKDDTWHFSVGKKSERKSELHFYEDDRISDRFGSRGADTEAEVNLMRCNACGEKGIFARIIEQTFFADELDGNRRVAVPAAIRKTADSLAEGQFLRDALNLSAGEVRFLLVVYRIATTTEFVDVVNATACGMTDPADVAKAVGIPQQVIDHALSSSSLLRQYDFIDYDGDIQESAITCLRAKSVRALFAQFSRSLSLKKTYQLESFSVKAETTALATHLLGGSAPVSILLYGEAGSGKTEYARSLAKACGLEAVCFTNSYEAEYSSSKALVGLNLLLSAPQPNTLFIVDEADCILETAPLPSMLGGTMENATKGTVNKLFERCANKVVWIVNRTDQMDESTKRRFTYSIHFDSMGRETFSAITESKLRKVPVSPVLRSRLVALCGQYEVTGSSIDNMVSVMQSLDRYDDDKVVSDVRNMLEANSSLLYGQAKMRSKTSSAYDAAILNTSVPSAQILEMVENARRFAQANNTAENGIRMLFYGLSGTGKTELARYLAQKLHKRVLLKRASDILGKFVGESEKNISEAFAQAERTGQVLLFDEADSFFRERASAQNAWEITQTNEFLTQMEEFKGILICTTNLRNIMDKAMLRRFHICVEFKALKEDGIKTLLQKYFSAYQFADEHVARLCAYQSVTPGDFGSLAGRIRFLAPGKITAQYIADELCALQEEKAYGSRAIGFGA